MLIEQPPQIVRWLYPRALWRMDKKVKAVYLTFDDGPIPEITPWVLDLLDKYHIKPIVGVIPDNQDSDMVGVYPKDEQFWKKVQRWKEKGWIIALHGYTHVFETREGGLNPVNDRSEFAGVPLERQKEKICAGIRILREHGIEPEIFFAPAHTFDENTLKALKEESNIRIISDTIANDVYFENGFYFIPQQSGRVRKLPFKTVTFCYHPNIMSQQLFDETDYFIKTNRSEFVEASYKDYLKTRKINIVDRILKKIYFLKHKNS